MGIKLRLRVWPRVTIGRDQIAPVVSLCIIELIVGIYDGFLQTNSQSNPPFEFFDLKGHLYVRHSILFGPHQSKSLATTAWRGLRGSQTIDDNLFCFQMAPEVVLLENIGFDLSKNFLHLAHFVMNINTLRKSFEFLDFEIWNFDIMLKNFLKWTLPVKPDGFNKFLTFLNWAIFLNIFESLRDILLGTEGTKFHQFVSNPTKILYGIIL